MYKVVPLIDHRNICTWYTFSPLPGVGRGRRSKNSQAKQAAVIANPVFCSECSKCFETFRTFERNPF